MSDAGGFDDGIEPGRRLIRVEHDKSRSLAERLSGRLHELAWRTPVHGLRLRGRYPLKLYEVPSDPIEGMQASAIRPRRWAISAGRWR